MSDENLKYVRQLDLSRCRVDVHTRDFGYEALAHTQDRHARYGLRILSVISCARIMPALLPGGPEHEADLEVFAGGIVADL